ncbi:uncharacterized protein AKAW2_60250A [Aspergillus luchuensis]|uniref:Uncharacterized protein n=2 Tax=Aspergillus kawachii TaxID=1069201 RepID=A0A7R8ACD3_ASPKA|nr:uncharacterized protein AKAW2_60250A [Aspergillus luchuensis]BCS01986.1 hypothetical protein AKAW2_60250A [Aspergillus luchuensis]BCS13676.1 hypothetical protein ALUC_60232A [Aspergillus luchuensis]GAA90423.1 similar to An15g04980 [Aspergillus luchuensis IFO 4308]
MRRRKKLLRTAVIAKAAFLGYRELHFDVDVTNIERRDNNLYLSTNSMTLDRNSLALGRPFPDNLTTDPKHQEAVLTWLQGITACPLSCRLVTKLLAGVPCDISMMGVNVGKRSLNIQVVPRSDSVDITGPDTAGMPHHILKVRVRQPGTDETWIMDLTGAQYGIQAALTPYSKYMADQECSIVGNPEPYNMTETWDLDVASAKLEEVFREVLSSVRQPRLRFAAFVDTVDEEILKGSPEGFIHKLAQFRVALKQYMLDESQNP